MPYRSLTHGRVRGAQSPPANAHTNQVKAIESQKGVGNNGPIRKNNSNNRQSTTRTLSRNFLMAPNAYGNGRFSPGQGKGFPEATPLPSVGSVNRFARRAIARRAVTKRIGVPGSENCCPDNKNTSFQNLLPNLSFTIQQFNNAGYVDPFLGPLPAGWPTANGRLFISAPLSNVQNVYTSNTSALFPNNKWGKSYITILNSPFADINKHFLQIGLSDCLPDFQIQTAKHYKLSVGDEIGVLFSIDIVGNVLNILAVGGTFGLGFKLEKDPAYDATNASTSAGANDTFEIFDYNPNSGNPSGSANLLTEPNRPNWWSNADWSGFFNRDFNTSLIDINTNKINISLTEI
uniref:Uncharacterized protein n=1 Tax=viral metagenome TaxID=1070528 RepID=A0A6C0KCU3_9ZZZZ